MARRLTTGVLVVALAATAVLLALSGPAIGSGSGQGIDGPPQTTPSGFNNTVFRIDVYENGSTKWTVRHSTPLNTQDRIDQFESYAERFRTAETDIFRTFKTRAERLTAAGTDVTGREMNASGFSRGARIERLGQDRGVVELSFWWSNFTRSAGERLVVDDVFSGGMFIDTGQRQFADRRPLVEFAPTDAGRGETPASNSTATPSPEGTLGSGAGPVSIAILLLVIIGVAGGVAWYWGVLDSDEEATSAESSGTDTATVRPDVVGPEPAPPSVSEEEFLSDEDRVVHLLEEHGGRMKQVNIVENTDWSKSKVSMLLSDMEEEGTITKLRVGRENIVSLSGEEPDAFGSPFDEE